MLEAASNLRSHCSRNLRIETHASRITVSSSGVKSVDINLENQVVRVLGTTTVKDLTAALAESGRKARLIGQGLPESKCFFVNFL